MRVYKLYATGTSTANNVASIQMVRNGIIRAITWACGIDGQTDNAQLALELSFQGTAQTAVNDTIGPIDELRCVTNLLTSGMYNGEIHKSSNPNLPIGIGERLYVNAVISSTLGYYASCFIFVDEK